MEVCGRVERKPFATGSKSERHIVYLVCKDGEYLLRRPGGNAYQDPEIEALVGKLICCKGEVVGRNTLLVTEWRDVSETPTM
jgi:hypothetical protein